METTTPPEVDAVTHPGRDHRQDTDDQQRNNWSAKVLQPVLSLKKAAQKLQPSEETKKEFRIRRYRRAEKFIQGLRKVSRTVAPFFQGECPI